MRRLRFSPSSRRDLSEILARIGKDNPSAAATFVKKIKDVCVRIARFPEIGPRRDDLAPNLQCFPVGNYIVFYQIGEAAVNIVRVLHASRDYGIVLK